MSRTLVVRGLARVEAETAAEQYEVNAPGLGMRFTRAVRNALSRITSFPELYGVVFRDIRCAPVRRFPYVILYRVTTNEVIVLAVLPARSDPAEWDWRA